MSIPRIRKGDDVIVIAGRNKGQRGAVLAVDSINNKVVVEGVNVSKRHTRPNPQKGTSGGIVEKEMPIHVSNVAMFNPVTGNGDRLAFKVLEDGRKVRMFRSTSEVVDL